MVVVFELKSVEAANQDNVTELSVFSQSVAIFASVNIYKQIVLQLTSYTNLLRSNAGQKRVIAL